MEIVVVLPETLLQEAGAMGERLRRHFESFFRGHPGPPVTISVGVAVMIPEDGIGPESLVLAADSALYEAKAGGRNQNGVGDIPLP